MSRSDGYRRRARAGRRDITAVDGGGDQPGA